MSESETVKFCRRIRVSSTRHQCVHTTLPVSVCSYLSTMLRTAGLEPMPSLSDVRRVVTEYCILPMGEACSVECHSYYEYTNAQDLRQFMKKHLMLNLL